jgi:hypothetical protein
MDVYAQPKAEKAMPLLTAILDITFKNDCHNVGAIY